MEWIGVSLAGRAGALIRYSNSSEISSKSSTLAPEQSFLPLEQTQVKTHQAAYPAIVEGETYQPKSAVLEKHRWMTWAQVISEPILSGLIERTIKSQQKTLYIIIQQERMTKYLELCWARLKHNFQEYLLKIQQKHL